MRGGRGRRGRGRRGGRRGGDKEEWIPHTKLGRLVKEGKIDLEDIFLWAIPIKEPEIIDKFLSMTLKDEVLQIKPVQKQTTAGQRTRFRATVVVGDHDGHVGLGQKASKEVAIAIRGAIIAAKLNVIPVRRGYWGSKRGAPHTLPCKLTGKCGSVLIKMIPAARGSGIVASKMTKMILEKSGIKDIFTKSTGSTRTGLNSAKALFNGLSKSYSYLTPDLWKHESTQTHIYKEHADFLESSKGVLT